VAEVGGGEAEDALAFSEGFLLVIALVDVGADFTPDVVAVSFVVLGHAAAHLLLLIPSASVFLVFIPSVFTLLAVVWGAKVLLLVALGPGAVVIDLEVIPLLGSDEDLDCEQCAIGFGDALFRLPRGVVLFVMCDCGGSVGGGRRR